MGLSQEAISFIKETAEQKLSAFSKVKKDGVHDDVSYAEALKELICSEMPHPDMELTALVEFRKTLDQLVGPSEYVNALLAWRIVQETKKALEELLADGADTELARKEESNRAKYAGQLGQQTGEDGNVVIMSSKGSSTFRYKPEHSIRSQLDDVRTYIRIFIMQNGNEDALTEVLDSLDKNELQTEESGMRELFNRLQPPPPPGQKVIRFSGTP